MTRAEKAGCPAVAVTVDRMGGRNQDTLLRLQRRPTTRDCAAATTAQPRSQPASAARCIRGVDISGCRSRQSTNMTWDFFKRLRDTTR